MKKTQSIYHMKSSAPRTLRALAISGVLAAFAPLAQASAISWTASGTDANWTTVGDWSGGALPTLSDDVTISTWTNGSTITLAGTQYANSLTLNPGTVSQENLSGGTIQIASGNITIGAGNTKTMQISSNIALNSAGTNLWTLGSATYLQLLGNITTDSASTLITVTGVSNSTLVLYKANNTYTGNWNISTNTNVYGTNAFGSGTVTLNNVNMTIGNASNQNLNYGNGFVFKAGNNFFSTQASSTITLTGTLSNSGATNIIFNNNGADAAQMIVLNGTSAFSNATLAVQSQVKLNNTGYLKGASTVYLGWNAGKTANLIWNVAETVDASTTFKNKVYNSGSTTLTMLATGTTTINGTYYLNNTSTAGDSLNLNAASGGVLVLAGKVTDYYAGAADTVRGITKIGAGTAVLSGTNDYRGATTVNAGKLAVNGSLSASSAVTVNSGGTLAGSGTIGGAVSVLSGGHFAPGNSISTTFQTGALTLNAGSITDIELGTANAAWAASVNDRTTISGALALGGTLNLIDNAGNNSNGSVGAGQYEIFTGASSVTGAYSDIVNVTGYHAAVDSTSSTGNVYVNNYQIAAANITSGTTVNLGITHVGQSFTSSTVSVKNTATSNGYAEGLNASASGTTGVATSSGTATNISGGTTSTALTVGLSDTTAGSKTGTITVGLASNGTISGYSNTTLDSQTIAVTGQVNYYAAQDFALASGDGVLTGSGTSYTLTLGTYDLHDADKTYTTTLTLTNTASSLTYQDILDGTLTLTISDGFTLDKSSVSLVSGSSLQLTVTFDTSSLTTSGTYNGLLTLSGTSVNTSSSTSLDSISVALELQVVPEPATWSMIVGGLGMMAFVQRARRRMSR